MYVKFNALKGRVIHGTQFWTETNIADGLNALAICIEVRAAFSPLAHVSSLTGIQMVFFSLFMMWSFTWIPYRAKPDERLTSIRRPLWDSINLCMQSNSFRFFNLTHLGTTADFAVETFSVFFYFASRLSGRRPTPTGMKFRQAFGIEGYPPSQRSMEQQGGANVLSHTGAISE